MAAKRAHHTLFTGSDDVKSRSQPNKQQDNSCAYIGIRTQSIYYFLPFLCPNGLFLIRWRPPVLLHVFSSILWNHLTTAVFQPLQEREGLGLKSYKREDYLLPMISLLFLPLAYRSPRRAAPAVDYVNEKSFFNSLSE
jgi:hypothetical protein